MKGHLKKRSKDSWTIVVDLGLKANGKRNQKWKSIKGTKKEAEALLARMLTELEDGIYIEPSKTSVSEYLTNWLKSIDAKLSAKTYERYEEIINNHFIPNIGHHKLNKLHPLHIETHYSELLHDGRMDGKGGLSKTTVLHHHRVLKKALSKAVKWHYLVSNPCDAIDPPKPDKKEIQTLTTEETQQFLEKAQGSDIYLPILLAVTTGIRLGELCGLRWIDIDLDNKRLSVRQVMSESRRYGIIMKEPKTRNSNRSITLSNITVDALKRHKTQVSKARLQLGVGLSKEDLIFEQIPGDRFTPTRISSAYNWFIKKNKLKRISFHSLRHTHATHLLECNIHPKIVSERLGHATIGITLDTYSHVMPNMQVEAADKMDELFSIKEIK